MEQIKRVKYTPGQYNSDGTPTVLYNLDGARKTVNVQKTAKPTSDGVNDVLSVALYHVNSPTPAGNKWSTHTPVGAFLFVRSESRTKVRKRAESAAFGSNIALRASDRLHMVTPERLNYLMHERALDNTRPDFWEPNQLQLILNEWRPLAFNNSSISPTEDERATTVEVMRNTFYAPDNNVVKRNLITEGPIDYALNYWGGIPSGSYMCHLFFLLIEVNIDSSGGTIYDTGGDTGFRSLGCEFVDAARYEKEMKQRASLAPPKQFTCKYVPRLVAKWSTRDYLTLEERKYTIVDEFDQVLARVGQAIYVGRCANNRDHDHTASRKQGAESSSRTLQVKTGSGDGHPLNVEVYVREQSLLTRPTEFDFQRHILITTKQ